MDKNLCLRIVFLSLLANAAGFFFGVCTRRMAIEVKRCSDRLGKEDVRALGIVGNAMTSVKATDCAISVGGGTAGCVLAGRLSEEANRTVLLLEAGGDDREVPDMSIPGKAPSLLQTENDWCFKGAPHKDAFKGMEDQAYNVPRGKVLGGTGSINNMMYMRGTPHDYDLWKNMGCTGWSYKDVLPYFIKSERCLAPKLADKDHRGTNGPMMTCEARVTPLAEVLVEAGKAMGYKEVDLNGPDPIGVMVNQSNIGDGIRQNTAECFLRPASSRENLHIATHCHVTKVLFDNKIARAVEYVRRSIQEPQIVRARQEIILCGGTVSSPQILMLSGIGPAEHLKSLGIDVVSDLPVGDNLQDHIGTIGLDFEMDAPYSILAKDHDGKENTELYEKLRAGVWATTLLNSTALIRTSKQDPGNPNPDVFMVTFCSLFGCGEDDRLQKHVSAKKEVWDAMYSQNLNKHGFSLLSSVAHPKSRGTIRLRDSDPFSHPLIDHNCLSHPEDIKTAVEGVKFIMEWAKTKPMRDIGVRYTGGTLLGYTKKPFTDEYWEEMIRTFTFIMHHLAGTCRMGPVSDPRTVVDPQLRVKGVERLRVVDASIMPEITSANLYAPVVMIAEKAADIIKGRRIVSDL